MPDLSFDPQLYAWNWFALHSNQRMQLVNFWLIAVVFLGAAFVAARVGNVRQVAVGVSAIGVGVSIAFTMLDARAHHLVQVGEIALQKLEDERSAAGSDSIARLVSASHEARLFWISSYRFVIRGLQLGIALLFAGGAAHTLLTR